MSADEIVRLRQDNLQLRMLVEETRESRDQAEAKAKETVQAEMAELRKTIAAARARLPYYGKGTLSEMKMLLRPQELVDVVRDLYEILTGGKGEA